MGSRTGGEVLLDGVANDERLAPPLRGRRFRDAVVEQSREHEGEHQPIGFLGRHTGIMGRGSLGVNTRHSGILLASRSVEDAYDSPLATLIRTRREGVSPKMNQTELGRAIGLKQQTVANIENGVTQTLSPEVANKLVTVLPITMRELLTALGFTLPAVHSPVPEDVLDLLETASPETLDAVRALALGARAMQQDRRRRVS